MSALAPSEREDESALTHSLARSCRRIHCYWRFEPMRCSRSSLDYESNSWLSRLTSRYPLVATAFDSTLQSLSHELIPSWCGTNQPTNQSQQYIRTSLALLSESAAIMQQIQDAAASGAVTLVDTTRPTHSQQAVDDDGDASRAANQPEQDAHTTATTVADTTTTHGPADGTAIQHAASSTTEQRHGPSRQTTTETTRSASKYVPMYV